MGYKSSCPAAQKIPMPHPFDVRLANAKFESFKQRLKKQFWKNLGKTKFSFEKLNVAEEAARKFVKCFRRKFGFLQEI